MPRLQKTKTVPATAKVAGPISATATPTKRVSARSAAIELDQLAKGQVWKCSDGLFRRILHVGVRLIEYRMENGTQRSLPVLSSKTEFMESFTKLKPVLLDNPQLLARKR